MTTFPSHQPRPGSGAEAVPGAYRTLVECISEGAATLSDEGTVVYANGRLGELLGRPAAQLLGVPIGSFVAPPHTLAFTEACREALTGTARREVELVRADGSAFPVAVALAALPDSTAAAMTLVVTDLTDRHRGEHELQLRSELLDLAHDAVLVIESGENRITYWNRGAQAMYGYSAEEAQGCVAHELLATAFPESREAVAEALARDGAWVGELRHTCKDGTVLVVASRQALHRDERGQPVAVIVLSSDVTAQRQAEEANRLLAAVVQSTHDAVLVASPEGVIVEWNRGAVELYGYPAEEAIGRPASLLDTPERAADDQEMIRRVVAGDAVDPYETVQVRNDGTRVPVSLTVSTIRDDRGEVIATARISRDISDRMRHERELAHLADHDSLTGLFNRRRFQEELEHELARARRDRTTGALLAIDLDHFKFINDSQGHHVGDQLIIQAGASLRQRLRETDVISRMGGDEFAVLLRGVDVPTAQRVAAQLLDGLGDDIDVPIGVRRVSASIGIAPYTAEGQLTVEDLFVEADIAMYDAKETGRGRAAVYDPGRDRHRRLGAGLGWADRIRDALADDGFVLHAQPIMSLAGDPRPRHELLVRMVAGAGELVAPSAFLPVAERMNLISEIDRWVLHAAIRRLAAVQHAGSDLCLHVNLSGLSLADPGLAAELAEALRSSGADGRGLCLEITESTAIVNVARAKRFAAEIAELGCELALDDFGAGYASFYYLKHLSFDFLKIDGEFIQNLNRNATDHLVVQTFANIAKTLGKRTIAEHVADDQTIELLHSYGIDFAQGFYIGRPTPLDHALLAAPPEPGTGPAASGAPGVAVLAPDAFRALYDHSPDGVLLTAPDGRVLTANRAACELLQRTESEICALGRQGVTDPADARWHGLLAERQRTGRVSGCARMIRGDGTTIEVEVSAQVFIADGGEVRNCTIIRHAGERLGIEARPGPGGQAQRP